MKKATLKLIVVVTLMIFSVSGTALTLTKHAVAALNGLELSNASVINTADQTIPAADYAPFTLTGTLGFPPGVTGDSVSTQAAAQGNVANQINNSSGASNTLTYYDDDDSNDCDMSGFFILMFLLGSKISASTVLAAY